MSGGISDFISKFMNNVRESDGKVVGDDGGFIKVELAPNDKSAWINHMAEQHLKKEKLDTPPPELEITMKDVIRELFKREIKKMFGK